jgi:hypothetical protein
LSLLGRCIIPYFRANAKGGIHVFRIDFLCEEAAIDPQFGNNPDSDKPFYNLLEAGHDARAGHG